MGRKYEGLGGVTNSYSELVGNLASGLVCCGVVEIEWEGKLMKELICAV
jgi:hypothetical protein